jgi:protein-L-isoaspartate(D-aspartate) O-methyltransferase
VLIDRLNPGGRLAAIVGTAPVMQAILMERVGSGLAASVSGMRTSVLFDTLTKPMEDAPRVSKFTF